MVKVKTGDGTSVNSTVGKVQMFVKKEIGLPENEIAMYINKY